MTLNEVWPLLILALLLVYAIVVPEIPWWMKIRYGPQKIVGTSRASIIVWTAGLLALGIVDRALT